MRKSLAATLLCLILFYLGTANVMAESSQTGKLTCPDAFPNMFTEICWKAVCPLRIAGNVVMSCGDILDNVSTDNADDFNPSDLVCSCKDSQGVDRYGIYVSYWEPVRVIEVTRNPGCYAFLFGMDMNDAINLYGAQGQSGTSANTDEGEHASHNVHYYTFPLMYILEMLAGNDWCTDWLMDIDILATTVVDPLWRNDELTIFTHPDAIAWSLAPVQALCSLIDCPAATAGYPINYLQGCAGCWGNAMPYTGNTGLVGSPVRVSSLSAYRLLARYARFPVPPAIEWDTSSAMAKCGGVINPFLKKSQYRMSMIYPLPQTEGRCAQSLGSSTMLWGEHRNVIGKDNPHIYLIFRKRNCCLKML
ncbi:MAG TPA: TraU family protein [Methanoregulaceae archaeon]|nr:TraU family protein [Sedimentisphaerales bacterium]HPD11302.1 TraU family protein [Methanoregulaceae archaeon]